MRNGDRISARCALTTMLLVLALNACVGSETGARGDDAEGAAVTRRVVSSSDTPPDTVSPAGYSVFKVTVESESPRRVTLRLLALGRPSRAALNKTVRVALDSLGRADSALVAARAILYTGQLVGPRDMKLIPSAWGLWIPPEGWDSATVESRNRIHRSFVYSTRPPWYKPAASSPPGVEND